jgi:hypothetical protein
MASRKLRYEDFYDRINVDAFEEAIGWTPEYEQNGNDVGYCLFPENHAHGDTTGKFAIHREMRVYNCFVCGGGSLLSLAMEVKSMGPEEGLHWLYQFCEEDMRSDHEFVDEFLASFEDVEERVATLPYFNERVLDQYPTEPLEDALEWDEDSRTWMRFVDRRAILPDVAAAYGVRYVKRMERLAPSRGKFADDDPYEGPAILFPHTWKGRLVGWQTRWLDPNRPEWLPKYTNTIGFPRETTIYGYDQAKQDRSGLPVVVTESGPSSLFVISTGYPSVATFGSNTNDAQIRLLRRFSNGVILAHDHDIPKEKGKLSAGIKWRNDLTNALKRYVDVYHLPPVSNQPGADIGDLAKADDPGEAVDNYLAKKTQVGVDF